MRRALGALALMQIGFMLVTPIVIFLLVGLWLDTRLGTAPLLLLLGIALGIATGAIGTWRLIRDVDKEVGIDEL